MNRKPGEEAGRARSARLQLLTTIGGQGCSSRAIPLLEMLERRDLDSRPLCPPISFLERRNGGSMPSEVIKGFGISFCIYAEASPRVRAVATTTKTAEKNGKKLSRNARKPLRAVGAVTTAPVRTKSVAPVVGP